MILSERFRDRLEYLGFRVLQAAATALPLEVASWSSGLAWRLIFAAHKGVLTFDFAGDHNEVQSYLRNKR